MSTQNPALESLLQTQPALWRGHEQQPRDTIKTGFADLDQALPGGGLCPGTLTELLLAREGTGEFSLLLPALKNITRQGQWAALVKPPYIPYAPALANAGIELDRILVVNPDNDKDTLWATEQLLRAGTLTAVICWLGKTGNSPQRRLQLAAETGHSLAIAYRPASAASDASAAALRILLSAQQASSDGRQDKGLVLDILKSRGGRNQPVFIRASDFDKSQGVEWPGLNPA